MMRLFAPPSSAEVKSEWNYTTTTPTRLHVLARENFTLVCEVFYNWSTGLL